jgi:glycosyltransferase involved in cell wall biosynthesis
MTSTPLKVINENKPNQDRAIELSIIVPVVERYDDLKILYDSYAEEIKKITKDFEFIFVIDGHMLKAYSEIKKFSHQNPTIKIVKFPRSFGESIAISVGFEKANGRCIFTLSSYFQVEPYEIRRLYDALNNDECDVVVTKRSREKDSFYNRFQSLVFHKIIKLFTGTDFNDISCGLKGIKRNVVSVFDIYGDLHRFIPILAEHQGLRVKELKVKQKKEDTKIRIYKLRTYLNRLIDAITLFFLLRFTYRPMRFFGLIGSILIISGLAINGYLIYSRLIGSFPLTNKPSLFLASLLMVIGIQIFAVGLIGEIIIYTHSKTAKHFNVKEFIE